MVCTALDLYYWHGEAVSKIRWLRKKFLRGIENILKSFIVYKPIMKFFWCNSCNP